MRRNALRVSTEPAIAAGRVTASGHASGLGAIHHRPFPMASGEMDTARRLVENLYLAL